MACLNVPISKNLHYLGAWSTFYVHEEHRSIARLVVTLHTINVATEHLSRIRYVVNAFGIDPYTTLPALVEGLQASTNVLLSIIIEYAYRLT